LAERDHEHATRCIHELFLGLDSDAAEVGAAMMAKFLILQNRYLTSPPRRRR
jgi:hypothetical protein